MRILIVDDHQLVRRGVAGLLSKEAGWEICGEAAGTPEALEKASSLNPDLILLDISMPTMNGIEAAERIQQATPGSRVIFLTQNTDSEIMSAALNAGAKGYVLKANAATELLPVIAAALPDRSPV